MGHVCANCGSTTPNRHSEGWVESNGEWYCCAGCVHNKAVMNKHRGKFGIVEGLGQIAEGMHYSDHGMSGEAMLTGTAKVALGTGLLAGKGLFKLGKLAAKGISAGVKASNEKRQARKIKEESRKVSGDDLAKMGIATDEYDDPIDTGRLYMITTDLISDEDEDEEESIKKASGADLIKLGIEIDEDDNPIEADRFYEIGAEPIEEDEEEEEEEEEDKDD